MSQPIAYVATRYRCPHCRKSYAGKVPAERHVVRCFRNPERRTCITCVHRIVDDQLECAKGEENWPCCTECGKGWTVVGDGDYGQRPTCSCGSLPAKYLRILCPAWETE